MDCRKCIEGIILGKKKKTGDVYVFKCDCSLSDGVIQKIPKWVPYYSKFYEVENRNHLKPSDTPKRPPVPYKDDDDPTF